MRAVAREQHATMQKLVHSQASEGVHADPFQIKPRLTPQEGLDPRNNTVRLTFGHGIRVPTELKVNSPHSIRLLMEEHRLIWMKWGVEPEPPLSRKVGIHSHVGDQEPVSEGLSLTRQA